MKVAGSTNRHKRVNGKINLYILFSLAVILCLLYSGIMENGSSVSILLGGICSVGILSGILQFKSITYNKQQEKLSQSESEQKFRRAQLNSHFIFNSLSSISDYLNKNNSMDANIYLVKFAKLIRRVLENSENEYISIAEETDIIDLYLQIEKSRVKNKFDYEIIKDKNADLDNLYIKPFVLQPFIENFIWHSIPKLKTKTTLFIILKKEEENLMCEIRLREPDFENYYSEKINEICTLKKRHMGIYISKRRLELEYKNSGTNTSDINIHSSDDHSFVNISLPIIN